MNKSGITMKEFQKQIFDMIKSAYNGVDMMRGDCECEYVFVEKE